MGPFPGDRTDQECSGTFFYLNTNKKSITLDLNIARGAAILKKLLETADVFVENFSPGFLEKRGLSAEELKKQNPKLIVISISAFGQTGPYRDYQANNLTVSGMGGVMYTMRPGKKPTDRPVKAGGYQAEYSTGVLSFIAIVGALMHADLSHKSITVDISAMECVVSSLMGNISEYSYLGLSRRTNPYPIHGYPQGDAARCKDGWISLTPGIGGAPNIAFLIEKPELEETPLLAEPRARMAEPEKFDELIRPWLLEHDKWEITRLAQELRLAFTPVLSPQELIEDEQLKAREFFTSAEHPRMGRVQYPGTIARLSETPGKAGRAPLLGEHNEDIYGAIFPKHELDDLRAAKVI